MGMGQYLFVYGTLMAADRGRLGQAQRERLGREAHGLGPATTFGRLFGLGRYPGLVASDDAADIVHGEVFELADPDESLRWLDVYEGIRPGKRGRAEYARIERPVVLAAGRELIAFVYVYRRDVANARLLQGGRWLDRDS